MQSASPLFETDARFVPNEDAKVRYLLLKFKSNPYLTNLNMVITPETNASSKQWYQCQRAYQKAVQTPHPDYKMSIFSPSSSTLLLPIQKSVRSNINIK